jgi:diguanylate cyclase (GGDEF)-like protein
MDNPDDEAKGLDLGAIDYIAKPVSPPIVKARVRNHLELKRHRDILEKLTIELDRKNRELNMRARNDALTGLANRRYFNEILDAEIKRASRSGQVLSLILCDVDFFKNYNDHYGHVAGDKCLQAIGQILSRTFKRISDLPARYGGEEFAVVYPDMPPGNAGLLAEAIRREMLAQAIPHAYSAVAEFVTLSFGVVEARPDGARDGEWYINEADKALYRAKNNGRNQAVVVSIDC